LLSSNLISLLKNEIKTMKSNLFLFAATAIVIFLGCASQSSTVNNVSSETTSSEENLTFSDNSQNSLDWHGTYTGVVPCADCEGIETTILLNQDLTYIIKTKYLGKSKEVFENTGTFTWNKEGTSITLEGITNSASQYFVGENTLAQLNVEGNRITGSLAQNYMLKKESSVNTSVTENSETEISIIGIKWKLVELMGKAINIKSGSNREPFLQLNAEGRMTAYAGCNSMTGGYELKEGNRVSFSNIIATKMGCENMETERILAEVLGKTDSYIVSGNKLSLNRSRTALARFEAIK
jgi:copper homeostasis protein (lipoprotein)